MSRDNFDIPEVFRRAMEDAGWNDGDDDNGRKRRPFPRNPNEPRRSNRLVWIVAVLVILFLSLNWVVTTYTDWLWFTELGYQEVWLKQWGIRVLSFIIFFVLAALILLVNWHAARRRAIRNAPPNNPRILQTRGVGWLINGLALFLAFGFGSAMSANWDDLLRYFYRVPFEASDPIFNREISFYLFELPIMIMLQQWAISLLVLTLMGVVGIYAVSNLADIQRGQWQPQRSVVLRQHVALIGAFILGLWAVGYIFSIYELLYSDSGIVPGASYTDMNARLFAYYTQMITMAFIALALLYNVFRFDLRPVGVMAILWLTATLVMGGIYPGLLQRYSVDPNEIERESPYIAHNIAFTRKAFDLEKVETRTFDYKDELSRADLDENDAVLQNIRLWDYRPLLATYTQLQALRLYYQFTDIDIDRYEINGELRQVMLAARELNKNNLPFSSWVNRNLEFTHGYGIAMNPVDRVAANGQPEFIIRDLPPQSTVDIEVTQPEIYYGETTTDVVFVGSDRDEFSYPTNVDPVYTSYAGKGGVPLDNYLKRVAFALRLGDANVLLSDEINRNTRVQFYRQIQTRVRQITPYLALDRDPYIVVADGRLVWMQDAYTLSNDFPYSTSLNTRFGRLNYIRNSVKITIDAYDGAVNYYVADPHDPIIQTYTSAFPGLFRPLSEMPETLQRHVRYPEDLFRIQSHQYLTYHMTDVRVFYNQEDRWEIPNEILDERPVPMEPYYVILQLPGEEAPEYLLIQPFTPTARENMIGWMAARNDVPHYGELIVYQLPRQELIFGPSQIEARIDQDPGISQQFALWRQSGANVIRGNLLVIPINNSFLYVEPIYLQAATSALPELRRIILANGPNIVMRDTLSEALAALLEGAPTVDAIIVEDLEGAPMDVAAIEGTDTAVEPPAVEPTPEPTEALPTATATVAPPALGDATIEELIASASAHFQAAEEAQRLGDWARYGQELEALKQSLEQLSQLTNPAP